jgi:hypothetical protein
VRARRSLLWSRSKRALAPTWEYDTALRGDAVDSGGVAVPMVGSIKTVSNGVGGYQMTMTYDKTGRPVTTTTSLDSQSYIAAVTYDVYGRAETAIDPIASDITHGFGTRVFYSSEGFPIATAELNGGQIYLEVLALSARGQVRVERLMNQNGFVRNRSFDDNTGRLVSMTTTAASSAMIQSWNYQYDKHSNVTNRVFNPTGFNFSEAMTYDVTLRPAHLERYFWFV